MRDSEKDYIGRDQLERWEIRGWVKPQTAFSQRPDESGYKDIPNRLWVEREEVVKLFEEKAKIFLCGSARRLARSTNAVLGRIVVESRACNLEMISGSIGSGMVDV